jgi:outer membrane protein assembly factor BamB
VLATVGDGELVVRKLASGDVRWASTVDGIGADHRLAVYDDVVVVVGSRGIDLSIAAYDVATGATLWERLEPDASYWTHESGLIELTRPDGGMRARTLDPATGDVVGVDIRMHEWPAPDGYLVGSSDRTTDIALLDIATGRLVQPAIPAFGVGGIAAVGDAIVGFTDQDEIVLYDDAGVPVDQRRFVSAAFGDFAGRAELVGGAPGTTIGVVASGTSLGFDVADGRIEVVWEIRGRVGPAVGTAVGPLAIGRLVDPDTGAVGSAVVDVRDGTVVARPELDGERESDPLILHDGYVSPPAIGDPDRVVAAFDFDGTERWSLALGGDGWFTVDGGVLVEVDKGVLTVHG